jgi:GGDEF domain-containing protein
MAGQGQIAHRILAAVRDASRRAPWLTEAAAVFAAIGICNALLWPADPGFVRAVFNPLWIPVLLVSARYGFWPGLAAGVTAAAYLTLGAVQGSFSRSLIEQAAEAGRLWAAGGFVAAGCVMGLVAQRPIDRRAKLEREHAESSEREKRATQLLEKSEEARRLLESRIVGETRTLRTIYDAARKLESLRADDVYQGCLDIIAEHFYVKRASFYLRSENHLLLKAAVGAVEGAGAEGKIPLQKTLMSACLEENRMLTVRDLLKRKDLEKFIEQKEQPLAMIPVTGVDGQPIGVISIEKMEFIHLNRANLDLMALVADWTGRALVEIRAVEEVRRDRIHDEMSGLRGDAWFAEALRAEFARAAATRRPLSAAILKVKGFGFLTVDAQKLLLKTLAAELGRILSPWESACRYRWDGVLALILPDSDEARAKEIVLQIEQAAAAAAAKSGWSITGFAVTAGVGDKTESDLLARLEAGAGVARRGA